MSGDAAPGRTYGVRLERSSPVRLDRHRDAPGPEWRTWAASRPGPTAVDLFCGAGGLSLGLEAAGFDVILSVDRDPWALETHRANFAGPALDKDLSDPDQMDEVVRLLEGVPVDVVAGGPPCQPFSRAGRAKIRDLVKAGTRPEIDGRRELWRAFLEVVERVRPRAVLMENVPDMALGDDLATVRQLLDRLERLGYDADLQLVETWRYGVPQHRERLVVVAVADGRPFEWPKGEERQVTVRDAIGDLPPLRGGTGATDMRYTPDLTSALQVRARVGVDDPWTVHDHVTRAVRPDDRAAFRRMRPGSRYSDLPVHLRRYSVESFDDKYNRLAWDGLSRTITAHIAKDGYWYIHPSQHRTLTVREAARLQTFPDRFRFAGTRSHAFAQIGNAVPPAMAEAVARAVADTLDRPAVPPERRPSARRAELRRRLLEWAADQLPVGARAGDPWEALVGALLTSKMGRTVNASEVIAACPEPGDADQLAVVAARAETAGDTIAAARIGRLEAAARTVTAGGWDTPEWAKACGAGPSIRAWVRVVGAGVDGVVATSGTLRVAARVEGSTVDRHRRLSDGRVALARLVGSGPDVPIVNAALAHLGATLCRPELTRCPDCPLRDLCATAGQDPP